MFRYLHLYLLKNMYISIILSKENNTFYQVRLNCYFEEDRRVVLIKKTDTYQDLIQLLERQYDAENLVVKYQDGNSATSLRPANLTRFCRGGSF